VGLLTAADTVILGRAADEGHTVITADSDPTIITLWACTVLRGSLNGVIH
jgi:hypothetical protein